MNLARLSRAILHLLNMPSWENMENMADTESRSGMVLGQKVNWLNSRLLFSVLLSRELETSRVTSSSDTCNQGKLDRPGDNREH